MGSGKAREGLGNAPPSQALAGASSLISGKVGTALDAVVKIIRQRPSELRAWFRAKAEERRLDDLLDRICDAP
jgi:hypothetical protein